jgi:hypothetical protein
MDIEQLMAEAAKARAEGKFVTVRNEDIANAMYVSMVKSSLTTLAVTAGFIAAIIIAAKMF